MDFQNEQDSDNIDSLINDLGGCRQFQFFVTFFILIVKLAAPMSMMMMAFGNYNPGWKCLDNDTRILIHSHGINTSSTMTILNDTSDVDGDNECRVFERCAKVEFNPGMRTIVSEWHLLCDKAWIISLIISIQMVGVLIGAYVAGYLGDKFGRKISMYTVISFQAILNVITIFSTSWQMFAVMRFLIGLAIPFVIYPPVILPLEFVPNRWRNAVICFPVWSIGGLLFALAAMLTEDWRYMHGINALACFITILPCYWMPESLRWLVVKDKMKDASALVRSIARMNGVKSEEMARLQKIGFICRNRTQSDDHSFRNLLRKEVRKPTIIIGITCITMSVVYYAISFGVKSLAGSIYVKLFIMFGSEIPIAIVSSILPNYLGRKVSIIIFLCLSTSCLFCIIGLDRGADGNVKTTGVLICALIARVMVEPAWDITVTYIGELYPTVIRSTIVAYSSWVARIGGILAPYLIPNDPDTFFISYLMMAVMSFVCCSLLLMLPETKGKPLQDTWEFKVPDPVLKDGGIEDQTFAEKEKLKGKNNTLI